MIKLLIQQLPGIKNYEDLGLKSFLIFVILVLGFVIGYLYRHKEKSEKDLQARIDDIYKEHKDDLRLANTDYKGLSEKFYTFTQQIKELVKK
jgi:predicted negative regulator of RcsB-dependent stress response